MDTVYPLTLDLFLLLGPRLLSSTLGSRPTTPFCCARADDGLDTHTGETDGAIDRPTDPRQSWSSSMDPLLQAGVACVPDLGRRSRRHDTARRGVFDSEFVDRYSTSARFASPTEDLTGYPTASGVSVSFGGMRAEATFVSDLSS